MSFETRPVFVWESQDGTWDDASRSHPAMKWMEDYTANVFDKKRFDMPAKEKHTDDFTLIKSDGATTTNAQDSWKAAGELYAPFVEYEHKPSWLLVYDRPEGWTMVGEATLYYNLPGNPAAGEQKVKAYNGKSWDGSADSAFKFHYKKVDGGIKLQMTKIYNNPMPAIGTLIKRGVMKAEDLLQ